MRSRTCLLIVLCLVCFFSARAQSVKESESSLIFQKGSADVSIVIENPAGEFKGRIKIELLDIENRIRSQGAESVRVKDGKNPYRIALPLESGFLKENQEQLVWFRLRYALTDEKGSVRSAGIVSLSEILKDAFELRMAAAERFNAGQNFRVRIRAVDPGSDRPVEGVRIDGAFELELDTEDDEDELTLRSKNTTDRDGFALLEFKIPSGLKFSYDGDLNITGTKNGIVRQISEEIEEFENDGSVFLTTDKPIYQPGQSFKIRGLYFDSNNTVVAGSELRFTVKDEEGTVVFREKAKTSDFGIASVEWPIPEGAKLGTYHVEIESEESDELGRQDFKVTRYDLPNFTVNPKPDKTFYLPGDDIAEVTVKADYLFGQPVLKGKVRVVQETSRRWNWREQKYDVEEKQTIEGAVDEEGKFVAKVDLNDDQYDLKNSRWRRFADLNFVAYFTDLTTNRTEQRRFDIRISKEPIHIYLVRNRSNLHADLPVTAYISTFYPDGTPAVCDVEVRGREDDNYSQTFETLKTFRTNSLGAGKAEFFRPKFDSLNGGLYVEIKARDQEGRTGTFDETLYFYDNQAIRIETEKTILKPGESINVKLLSSKKDALVYVDVVRNHSVIESRLVGLKGGRADLKIPYDPRFKGDLTIAAYTDPTDFRDRYYYYDEFPRDARGVIYPEQQNLKLDARFSEAVYQPNEEAKVDFSVQDGRGKAVESALGVVVFDKAVEERARTDAEFGSYFSRFFRLLGYSKSFGGITLKDLNELDLSKPIPDEMQLAAEVMLADNYYYPKFYRSLFDRTGANSLYADYFKKQFSPIENALNKRFDEDFAHPTDDGSLRRILSDGGIDFDSVKDPWGQDYKVSFEINRTRDVVKFRTAGADKRFDTPDDLETANLRFAYFKPVGQKIDRAVENYHKETGGYIRDSDTLRAQLAKDDFDLDQLRDRWGRPYRIEFGVLGRFYGVVFRSAGPNGRFEQYSYSSDDFEVWQNRIDYFARTESQIKEILSRTVNSGRREFPEDLQGFLKLLKENGLDPAEIRDGYGEPVYIRRRSEIRYSDKTTVENGKQKITPVTEELAVFTIRSKGGNLMVGQYASSDDFDLASFSGVVSERSKDTKYEKANVKTISYTGSDGAIRGTVLDSVGAVIPGAVATATNESDSAKTYSAKTNDEGVFLIENVPSGTYSIRIDAAGFKSSVYSGVQVRSQNLVEIKATLEVGAIDEVVTVSTESSSIQTSVDVSDTKIDTNISKQAIAELPKGTNFSALLQLKPGAKDGIEVTDKQENSTPRLREYFPETLVWNPELVTDKRGRAEMKFRLADNITTWKLYTVASTKNGKVGVAEREFQAFQTFFVDLDPPKFLTEGDEIHLPTQIRNYTETKQSVDVSMAKSDWFSFLDADRRKIEVPSGSSENAVFGFRADAFVKDGKQRVTAVAERESDAIEKPVTVRPDGREIIRTESRLFAGAQVFALDFPANAIKNTPRGEVKIYPNLFSHVSESVEGLLRRPYGCGEQTISSTYPNLMILKFKSEPSAVADGLKAKADNPKSSDKKPNAASDGLKQKAQTYLQKGYERLLGYQVASGGFSYWGGRDESDVALTAYAIRFLQDARTFVDVDQKVIERAQNWLLSQQKADGTWTKRYYWESSADSNRTKLFTSYVARILALQKAENGASPDSEKALQKALAYLKARNGEIDEPYALALFALASFDAGNAEDGQATARRLAAMAIPEGNASYWKLETNTPFYGWGTAGRVETTALVVQALIEGKRQKAKGENAGDGEIERKFDDLISKGTLFLLNNKDRYGVWYSTQTTVNVLDAFLASLSGPARSAQKEDGRLTVLLNGETLQTETVGPDQIAPLTVDLSGKLTPAGNRLEIKTSSSSPIMVQTLADHYIKWPDVDPGELSKNTNQSRQLELDYSCDRQTAEIMQEVSCRVKAERVGFRGYGMLLAEIGTPPGADVSRESLEEALKSDWSLSRYDILPDRIIVYMWSKAGGTSFNFKFRPRYGIKAQTPASVVYDYYNPEAQALVAPLRFEVR